MAFKVESIQEMRTIADTMTQYATEADGETNKVVDAVEQLDALISGQGVDEALTKLKDSLVGNAENATKTLKYVSLFIKTTAASYAQNENETVSTLSSVENALNSVNL